MPQMTYPIDSYVLDYTIEPIGSLAIRLYNGVVIRLTVASNDTSQTLPAPTLTPDAGSATVQLRTVGVNAILDILRHEPSISVTLNTANSSIVVMTDRQIVGLLASTK